MSSNMKSRIVKLLLLAVVSLFALPAVAQGTGPKEKTVKEELKSNRQLRKERKEKRKLERAERKAIKDYHKRLQTKKVRKRMKESRQHANRNNDNRREFFLKRWFRKKK
jgi:hypothetical protein